MEAIALYWPLADTRFGSYLHTMCYKGFSEERALSLTVLSVSVSIVYVTLPGVSLMNSNHRLLYHDSAAM